MRPEPAADIRAHIVSAAESVITERGMAAATTRAIAERAGCAEGSIYRYFPDKHALFGEIFRTKFPPFVELMSTLPDRAGAGTVRRNLEEVVLAALAFYRGVTPLVIAMMSEHKLLHGQREFFEESKSGPMRSIGLLTTYIRREQRLGRICDRPSPEHITRLLLGACWAQAFLAEFLGDDDSLGSDERFAADLVRSMTEGLRPRPKIAPLPPVVEGATR